jgi:hypothetical protein
MKSYPTINGGVQFGTPVYIFDKLDGSNVRAEWTRKNGWAKFGRRNGLLDDSNAILKRKVPDLIRDKYGDVLAEVFRKQRWTKATAFFEFHGPNSFAGYHEETDDHTVTLLDVCVHPTGFLEPREFLKLFQYVETPNLIHVGNFTQPMREQVESGTLEGMTFEGVVAKGSCVSPGRPLMFKWKNQAWLDRLRADCTDEAEFERRR